MNKFVLGTLVFGLATVAQAKDYGAAGCGLGSKLFEGQSGLGPHVLAATTNNFYGTQTFAMTSGTLGCDVNDTIKSHMALYIDSNLDNIAQDAARGQGESLDALASVMNIQKEDQAIFASTLQENFDVIFTSESVDSLDVMKALTAVMKGNDKLSKYVS